jgi:hypothetical protein
MEEDGGVILYLQRTTQSSSVCTIRHSPWFRWSYVACGSNEGDSVATVHATIDVLYLLHGIATGNDVPITSDVSSIVQDLVSMAKWGKSMHNQIIPPECGCIGRDWNFPNILSGF